MAVQPDATKLPKPESPSLSQSARVYMLLQWEEGNRSNALAVTYTSFRDVA